MKEIKYLVFIAVAIISGTKIFADTPTLFENSVVSNEIDFITNSSRTVRHVHSFLGRGRAEMPDQRNDSLFDESAFRFNVEFQDGTTIDVFAHSSFGTKVEAEEYVLKLLDPVGKLPFYMRNRLAHVVIHKGNETAFAEHLSHFLVLYSENMDIRISNNDLEETVFHEAVHATLDYLFADDELWIKAQSLDCCFVTDYAKDNPYGEDLAETLLFAYTYYQFPGQLPDEVKIWLETNIPNRLAFIREHVLMKHLR